MSSVGMAGLNMLHDWQFFLSEAIGVGWQWVIITSHIRQHLDQHSILSILQHGFRKSYSCETQLPVALQDLFSYRDKNIQIDLTVLDFSKAFKTVPHKCRLGKLSHYGIKGPVLHWIRALLQIGPNVHSYRGHSFSTCSSSLGRPPRHRIEAFIIFVPYKWPPTCR